MVITSFKSTQSLRILFLLPLLWHCQIVLSAEGGTITTDRPSFSTGTHTLALRTGVSEKIELDLIWSGWNRDEFQGLTSETSRSDLSVGGKYRLVQNTGSNLTLFGLVSLPVGSDPSTSDSVDPLLGLLYDYNLADNVQFFANALVTRYETGNGDVTEQRYTVGLGFSHSPKLSSFIELYGALPNRDAMANTTIFDGGFTYYPSPDVQIDLSAGVGLQQGDSDFFERWYFI
jgi:hypothetical protein